MSESSGVKFTITSDDPFYPAVIIFQAALANREATIADLRTQIAEAVHRADAAEGLLREIGAYCEPIAPGLDPVGKALYERIGPLLLAEE